MDGGRRADTQDARAREVFGVTDLPGGDRWAHHPWRLALSPEPSCPCRWRKNHSPELQLVQHFWQFVDEPLANRCFATIESLDHAVGQRCSPSPTSATPPVTAPSSTGGRASHKRCNQPEPILLHLDTGKFDHLGPLRSFVCDEASEFGARTRRHGCS
jgi:hypothetical protein